MPVRAGFLRGPSQAPVSGMQEPVRRPAGRARAYPVFVGRLIPVAIHNLPAVIARSCRRSAFRLMVSPLFHGGKFPAAIGAAEFVSGWIYCRHNFFGGSSALFVLVLLPCVRSFQVALLLMRLNRLVDDIPLAFSEICLFPLAGIVHFR